MVKPTTRSKEKGNGIAPPPAAKKAKAASVDNEERRINTLWEHYSNFLLEGEIDELMEILDLVDRNEKWDTATMVWQIPAAAAPSLQRSQMLPVLISVVATLLVDASIAEYIQLEEERSEWNAAAVDEETHAVEGSSVEERKYELLETTRQHLHRALHTFPENAAAWQMATNFIRMRTSSKSSFLMAGYRQAADLAARLSQWAIAHLDQCPEAEQEWIVELLLHQVCGVDDASDDGDLQEEEWSGSKVEGMSRYMAAMIASMAQQHDAALPQLQALGITHRLHPTVWQHGMQRRVSHDDATPPDPEETASLPVAYQGRSSDEGVLPQHLYDRLCAIFHPEASYWQESDYAHRDYYSFFMPVPPRGTAPSNLMEEVVLQYLLPLVQEQPWVKDDEIVGYEWWVHTRPMTANLGHNLHFDTDEAGLRGGGSVAHPLVSSVLYLTGGTLGGTTVLLDQTPDATANADRAWLSPPVDNSFMMFPGNLLHGVLPCLGEASSMTSMEPPIEEDEGSATLLCQCMELLKAAAAAPKESPAPRTHRLTLMIGFWTRRVGGGAGLLYGPSGPLPPPDHAQWVRDLCRGYHPPPLASENDAACMDPATLRRRPLSWVRPAWENVVVGASTTAGSLLIIPPPEVDHRFFVRDAPQCFAAHMRQAAELYASDDDDDDEEEDVE